MYMYLICKFDFLSNMIWYDPSWPFHVSFQQVRCSSGRKFRPICVLVRRLRDLSSEATERLPRSKGYKNHPVHSRWPTSRNMIRRNHIERITMKTHWKNQVLQVCFFLFNLFHQYCTSVHFWWPVQDIVVLNDFEMLGMSLHKTRHSAACPQPEDTYATELYRIRFLVLSDIWKCIY